MYDNQYCIVLYNQPMILNKNGISEVKRTIGKNCFFINEDIADCQKHLNTAFDGMYSLSGEFP